ncbi:hypothetical protein H107_04065, partial [Trichophyton rubrum CBS 202.88]
LSTLQHPLSPLSSSISHLPPSPSRIASTLVTLWLVLVLVAVYSALSSPATPTSPRLSAIADFNLWPKREIKNKIESHNHNQLHQPLLFFILPFLHFTIHYQ